MSIRLCSSAPLLSSHTQQQEFQKCPRPTSSSQWKCLICFRWTENSFITKKTPRDTWNGNLFIRSSLKQSSSGFNRLETEGSETSKAVFHFLWATWQNHPESPFSWDKFWCSVPTAPSLLQHSKCLPPLWSLAPPNSQWFLLPQGWNSDPKNHCLNGNAERTESKKPTWKGLAWKGT